MSKPRMTALAVATILSGLSSTGSRVWADPVSPPVLLNASPNTTLTGSLPNQGTPLEISFSLASPSDLSAYTTSYASGGFQPNLTLYDGAGNYITSQSAFSPIAATNPSTGLALDGYLTSSDLPAGSYVLTLTDWELQQSITATNLSDGFTFNIGSGDQNFMDVQGNSLTSAYDVTISATAVPEPGTLGIVIAGGVGLIGIFRRPRHRC